MALSIFYFGAGITLILAMFLMLVRLFAGPTLYDRVLAVNSFGTKTVLFLVVFSIFVGRADGIDIALLYALVNFIAIIAILKFFRYDSFHADLSTPSPRERSHRKKQGEKTNLTDGFAP